ncbi:hypothetical protein OS493_001307 [Desmophyllum pertusum]|uniref:Uncharacterized protein n=1 Tax=Desmophyllum pertusum TaxID=174260 RepID=A0A9W9ZUA2_9CNID|nr:hypothetical protein OS493_001307 [Desmophyllum pertusum]
MRPCQKIVQPCPDTNPVGHPDPPNTRSRNGAVNPADEDDDFIMMTRRSHPIVTVAAPPEPCESADPVLPDVEEPPAAPAAPAEVPGSSEPADPVLLAGAETPGEVPGPSEPAVPVLPAGAEPLGEVLSDEPLEPVAEAEDSTVRRSTRQTAGQHPNPNREPRSAVNNSVMLMLEKVPLWVIFFIVLEMFPKVNA